jgi:hypothetical protein
MLVIKEKEQHLIYHVQGKQSYWVQRRSDPNLFCHVLVTQFGMKGDCPDAIYRKRLCKHCKWVIEREAKAEEVDG